MKVSAFLRAKSASKNDINGRATIYFRVRDRQSGTDIKAASELTISPNHWSQERQGYKGRVMMVSEAERMELDKAVMELTTLIGKEFYVGANSRWLQQIIMSYHHPHAYHLTNGKVLPTSFSAWVEKYLKERNFDVHQRSNITGIADKVARFELYMRKVRKQNGYTFSIGVVDKDDITEFKNYLFKEHEILVKYPKIAEAVEVKGKRKELPPKGVNTVINILTSLRTIINYAIRNGAPDKNPFEGFEMPKNLYGTPYYLTLEERDKVFALDLSSDPELAMYRDMFVFQCLVGCRHGDLVRFTPENIIDGVLEYIPEKTRKKVGVSVRVPLNEKALSIIARHDTEPGQPIFPLRFNFKYNDAIREMLTMAGVSRIVTVINAVTGKEEKRPLNEIGSSHMARRTFIGNLYKKVKDPNIIASMSGHVACSKAFTRYRDIDDDMKQELVEILQ